MDKYAIKVNDVTKVYALYSKPVDRLKESLSITKKSYHKDYYALKNISFDVKEGECVGLLGTNGAGKSTILKIITGVLNPTGGNVEINGKISALLELGAGFNPEYTGIENIYMNGTLMGFSRAEIERRMEDILDFADIGDFVHQPVKTYSSGMFVRLAFAVAINIDPEILIVDEALSVGDVFFQAKCYKKFEDFKKAGKTILLVTHSLGTVAKYCDRAIILDKGEKLAEGEPTEMIDLYKKVLVNQNKATIKKEKTKNSDSNKDENTEDLWKNQIITNPKINSYGNGGAEIIDFLLADDLENPTNQILKGYECIIKMKVKFNRQVEDPIFAITIVNLQGTEVCGTNTMYESVNTGICNEGDIKVVEFKQKLNLAGGNYLISFGCTGYENGEFVVYHRLYEMVNLQIVSSKNTVGYFDMNSKVTVE